MSKPIATPPELRRKKAANEAEGLRLYDEWTADGKTLTDEQYTQLDGIAEESRRLDQQIVSSERWSVAEERERADDAGDRSGRLNRDMPHNDTRNTHGNRYSYSMLKAMRSRLDPSRFRLDGIELETHQEMAKARAINGQQAPQGVLVPLDLPVDPAASMRFAIRSGLGAGYVQSMVKARQLIANADNESRALDTAAGAGSIPTILDSSIIELLRARLATFGLGAKTMSDMQGLFAIPRQTQASTFYMVGQGSPVTASNQTVDQVPFSPHTGGVYTQYTRQFLEQTNLDAEMFVREDQAAVVARGVETAAINGSGGSGYPLGLMQTPQIAVVPIGTNGGAPTWTVLVTMPTDVAYFNADVGSLGFLTDALVKGTLQTTLKISGSNFPIYLWNTEAPEAPVAGYPCATSNLMPQNLSKGSGTNLHAMIYGNWSDLIYAFWSGMDVIVDPYTSAPSGGVNIITLQDFDVNIRHYQSFAVCNDIISGITSPVI